MQTVELKGGGLLREGGVIDVPYLDSHVTFVMPQVGPDKYEFVMAKIDSQKLLRPTTAQVLALVDLAQQNQDVGPFPNILEKFERNYHWTATENLSVRPIGAIVYDNVDGKMPQEREGLMALLEAQDPRVRFIERGFEIGWMPLKKALKHDYLIAQIGEGMIPIYERVAQKHADSMNPKIYVGGLDGAYEEGRKFTALDGGGRGMSLSGYCGDSDRCGFAAGLFKAQ